jgi:predicted MFS family arabinose efflux permease
MAQMAVAFVMFALQKDGDTSLWMFALALVVLGFGFGLAINPGTTLIIDGLPEDRRTLAAAVNDVTREVGGALGSAVAASVLLAVYGDQVLSGVRGIPEPAAQASEEGVAQAVEAGGQLEQAQGAPLIRSAVEAFASGYAAAMWVGAATLLVGAVVVVLAGRRRTSSVNADVDSRAEDSGELTAAR